MKTVNYGAIEDILNQRVGSLPSKCNYSVNFHLDCMKSVQDGFHQEENGETYQFDG
jgi:hypothetical protein